MSIAAELLVCLVVGVLDGDTLDVRCGEPGAYEQTRIRLSAIDTPEKAQPFGQRAKKALSDLCFKQQARVMPVTTDRYKRVVADVECRGQDVGQHMVRHGWAWVYRQYARGYDHLYPLERAARDEKAGLWADAKPVPPWEWRRGI
ncbi:thermonuclease family protein [Leptospira sp. 96542]|nr:thermonuclease family protein [Leptospira sp. 96542]